MSNEAVARRYAEALFQLAQEKNLLDVVEDELGQVLRLLQDNKDLSAIFENQLIPEQEKIELFGELFNGTLNEITTNFIFVLLEKRRERNLTGIVTEYVKLANAKRNLVEAEVRTASVLTPEDKKALEKKLSKSTGKNIRVTHKVDTNILGGAVIKIGDKVIDGSVASRLLKLKDNLMS